MMYEVPPPPKTSLLGGGFFSTFLIYKSPSQRIGFSSAGWTFPLQDDEGGVSPPFYASFPFAEPRVFPAEKILFSFVDQAPSPPPPQFFRLFSYSIPFFLDRVPRSLAHVSPLDGRRFFHAPNSSFRDSLARGLPMDELGLFLLAAPFCFALQDFL